jgi:hypothetical protein
MKIAFSMMFLKAIWKSQLPGSMHLYLFFGSANGKGFTGSVCFDMGSRDF